MGPITIAGHVPMKGETVVPPAAAPTDSLRVWTFPRIASISGLVAVPLIVVSVRPSSWIVLVAIVLEAVFMGLSAKACLIE